MKEIIIYGTGKEGENAFWTIRRCEDTRILFWVDSNPAKVGKKYFGREICSPDILKDYTEVPVLVAVYDSCGEIEEMLHEMGVKNVYGFGGPSWNRRYSAMALLNEMNTKRCIDLKQFLLDSVGGEFSLKELPLANYGESGVLDYAFLYALGKRWKINSYLEIGTNVGTSINIMAEFVPNCYSITAPLYDDEINQTGFCRLLRIPDYSERLAQSPNITHFYGNSQEFDYSQITEKIDMYFIDADHSYNGVYCDTLKVFEHRTEDSFVVWHDFQQQGSYDQIVLGVKDALGKEFSNVYVTNSNICAIYIPEKYQKEFPYTVKRYQSVDEHAELCVYDATLRMKIIE